MKFSIGNKVVSIKLSNQGKDYIGYILSILFLAFVLASPIILGFLFIVAFAMNILLVKGDDF